MIGSGPIGLTIAQMADLAGAASVAILGKPDGPLQIAQQMIGAIPINVDTTDPVEEVKAWTSGRGATVVFEAVGGTANTLMQATEIAAKRGKICMVGGHVAPLRWTPVTLVAVSSPLRGLSVMDDVTGKRSSRLR